MKKLFFIVLFGIMALFMTKVYAEESIPFYKVSTNVLTKFENLNRWNIPLFAPYLINGKMFLDTSYEICTDYDEKERKCKDSVSDSFFASTDNMSQKFDKSYSYQVFDNTIYVISSETINSGDAENKQTNYTITKYDDNYNQIGQVQFTATDSYGEFTKNINDELVLVDLSSLYGKEKALYREEHGEEVSESAKQATCNYVAFDSGFTSATEKPCDDTIVPESIKNYIIQNDRTISSDTYDIDENRSVIIYKNKLYYYENNELVFERDAETENAHFFKVRFLDKYIVVGEDHVNDEKSGVHYSKLLFYDKNGNIVKTIDDNNNLYDFNVDREINELVATNVDYDGVCALSSYGWVKTCLPSLSYSLYVYGQEPEKTPEKTDEVIGEESNPNTSDFVIIIITILCVSIVLLTNTRHHKKELED